MYFPLAVSPHNGEAARRRSREICRLLLPLVYTRLYIFSCPLPVHDAVTNRLNATTFRAAPIPRYEDPLRKCRSLLFRLPYLAWRTRSGHCDVTPAAFDGHAVLRIGLPDRAEPGNGRGRVLKFLEKNSR